jgi:hypothetical protein
VLQGLRHRLGRYFSRQRQFLVARHSSFLQVLGLLLEYLPRLESSSDRGEFQSPLAHILASRRALCPPGSSLLVVFPLVDIPPASSLPVVSPPVHIRHQMSPSYLHKRRGQVLQVLW